MYIATTISMCTFLMNAQNLWSLVSHSIIFRKWEDKPLSSEFGNTTAEHKRHYELQQKFKRIERHLNKQKFYTEGMANKHST